MLCIIKYGFYFVVPLKIKSKPLKQTFTLLSAITLFFTACRKENNFVNELPPMNIPVAELCNPQTDTPANRSYSTDSVVAVQYSQSNCGLIPLSNKNYWVYKDSMFADGVFQTVKFDTLRYTAKFKSLNDGLIWWQSNMYAGIPELLYANDSSLFEIGDRLFTQGIKDVRKDYSLFAGDSIRYLANFQDAAAMGRSIKLQGDYMVSGDTYSDCIFFEKNARDYRRDRVYFKPGLGVVKYIHEKSPMGQRSIKLQQVLTLVDHHIE